VYALKKTPFRRPRCRSQINIKMDVNKIICEDFPLDSSGTVSDVVKEIFVQ
jgi:hypothetical protein